MKFKRNNNLKIEIVLDELELNLKKRIDWNNERKKDIYFQL